MSSSIEDFLLHARVERNLSPHTLDAYRVDLSAFAAWCERAGITNLAEVDLRACRRWLALAETKGLTRTTLARRASTLRTFFGHCCDRGFVDASPVAALRVASRRRRLPRALSREEVDRLLSSPDPSRPEGLRDLALLELLYGTGMRVAEACGLTLDVWRQAGTSIRVWGKGRKERVVPLGEPARVAMEAWISRGRPLLAGRGARAAGALFLNARGSPLTPRDARRVVARHAPRAGVSPHTLRHTYATHLLLGGAGLRDIQELLGHADISTTGVYTHLDGNRLAEVHRASHPRACDRGVT